MVNGMTGSAWLCMTFPMMWFYWGPGWAIFWAAPALGAMVWRRWKVLPILLLLLALLLLRLEWEALHSLPRVEQHRVYSLTVCLDQPTQKYGDYQAGTARVVAQPPVLALRKVRITAQPEMVLAAGYCTEAEFRLRQPLGRLIPGGFNVTRYYFTQRVDALATLVKVHRVYPKPTFPTRLYQRAENEFQQPEALGVWAALALGWSKALEEPLAELFEQNQIKHLMVVSGMHVGMVGAWGIFFATWLTRLPGWQRVKPEVLRWAMVTLSSGAFVALTGFGFPAIRAWVMLVVPLSLRALGYRLAFTQVLAIAAVTITVWQPQAWMDSGAWLSFGLVAVLVRLSERWQRSDVPVWQLILRLQLALAVFMIPVGALMGFDWHPLSVPINLVMIPLVTAVVLPWSLLILVWPSLAWVSGYEWLVLKGISVLEVLAAWHGDALIWNWAELGVMAVGLGWVSSQFIAIRYRWLAIPLVAVLWFTPKHLPSPDGFRMTMLDVGHGEAILLEWPESTWIYDTAGQWSDGRSVAEERLAAWFKRRGVELDGIIVSHADLDHAGGVGWAVRQWPHADRLAGEPEAVARLSASSGWENCHLMTDQPALPFRVLPVPDVFRSSANDHSCVIAIEASQGRVLITGDAGRLIEYWLLQRYPQVFPVGIQVIGHHGSHTSSARDFLNASPDALMMVSSGDRAAPRWPSAPLLSYLQTTDRSLLNTAERGTLEVTAQADGWRVRDWMSAYRERLVRE